MKKISIIKKLTSRITVIGYCLLVIGLTSCQDMFEPADENTRQEDAMYEEPQYAHGLLIYAYDRLPYKTTCQTDVATDDAVINTQSGSLWNMTTGAWAADNDPMTQWDACKDGIQYANKFLTIVDKVKWAPSADSKQLMFIDRMTGEALGLRAILYYHLLQAHAGYTEEGELLGVPLLTEPEDGSSDYNQPRSSFEACVRQIFADCDRAMDLLPLDYKELESSQDIPEKYKAKGAQLSGYNLVFGNAARNLVSGKAVAAVKAQAALLATSPAFINNSGVTYEEAATICGKILKLFGGMEFFDKDGNIWYKNTVKLASSDSEIPEVLWRGNINKKDDSQENTNFPPTLHGSGQINPSQNLVDAFPMANGYPINYADKTKSGYDEKNPYANRDPRLSDDVIFNGMVFKESQIITGNYPNDKNESLDNIRNNSQSTLTGYYMKKLLREDAGPTAGSSKSTEQPHVYPRIRATEIFLAYAEIANEAWGPTAKGADFNYSAYDVIKAIRERGGIGKDADGNYVGDPFLDECAGSKEKMRELIRNERRIELCFENKRFWDMRRWLLPLDETVKGIQIERDETTEELTYTIIDVENRKFYSYQCYGPIPMGEVLKWSELKQNKGW
jgi:hypothetical protein